MSKGTEIISIDGYNLADLFDPSKKEVVEKLVKQIEKAALAEVIDCSTEEGRKRSWNLAREVSSCKTAIDDFGKSLVIDAKTRIQKVDQIRKGFRDHLEAIRDKVLEPRVQWEKQEQERKSRHMEAIQFIQDMRNPAPLGDKKLSLAALETNLNRLEEIEVDKSFEEFEEQASMEWQKSYDYLITSIKMLNEDIERDEKLARLEAEEAKRKEEAEKERLRLEGEERARKKLEEEAEAKRLADLKKASEIMDSQPVPAEDRRTYDPETDTVLSNEAKAAPHVHVPQAATEVNNAANHKRLVNRAIRDAIAKAGSIDQSSAQAIVTAIYYGNVPNLRIEY